MQAIKEKNKYLMIVLGVVLALCAICIFLINKQISKEKKEILEFKEMISKNSDSVISLDEFKNKINEIDLKSQQIDKLYISNDEIIKFIETIENLADNNKVDVEIGSVDVKKVEKTEKKEGQTPVTDIAYNNLNMVVSAKGGWAGVTGLLKEIENLPYGIRIDSSKLNYTKDAKVDFWTLNFSIKIITI